MKHGPLGVDQFRESGYQEATRSEGPGAGACLLATAAPDFSGGAGIMAVPAGDGRGYLSGPPFPPLLLREAVVSSSQVQRGTGRTTEQLRAAPQGALFIAPTHAAVWHCLDLARKIGRTDIKMASPGILNRKAIHLRGTHYPAIVLDHAAAEMLTEEQVKGYEYIRGYIERRHSSEAERRDSTP